MKAGRAARLLSGFNFEDCKYASVSVYFRGQNAFIVGRGVNTYDDAFPGWEIADWRDFIIQSAKRYGTSPRVVTMRVFFAHRESNEWCSLEVCDFAKNPCFDRLIFCKDHHPYEATLTKREQGRIRGVSDAVKLAREIPGCRLRRVQNDLPLMFVKDLHRRSVLLGTI